MERCSSNFPKMAAIIDPQRDGDIYINDAKNHGFEIKHVILTHFHADFVAGHIELRDRVDSNIYLCFNLYLSLTIFKKW